MQCAETAAQRGHETILLERGPALGGQLLAAAALPHREAWLEFIGQLGRSLTRLGVDIRLETEATADDLEALAPDRLVLATGSRWDTSGFSHRAPLRDAIPVAKEARVVDPLEAIEHVAELGPSVVVLDDNGTYSALGIAELIAQAGHHVEFVTGRPMIGDQAALTGDLTFVLPRLISAGVRLSPSTQVDQISAGEVELTDLLGSGTRRAPADTTVISYGRHADAGLYDQVRDRIPHVTRIGDCLAPREVDEALYEAVSLGRTI
jgi:hypothetical protein